MLQSKTTSLGGRPDIDPLRATVKPGAGRAEERYPMSIIVSLSSADRFGPAEALYRLTGLGYFSPAARASRARYARTLSELEQMSTLELAEFGLHRCDIRRVAREAAAVG